MVRDYTKHVFKLFLILMCFYSISYGEGSDRHQFACSYKNSLDTVSVDGQENDISFTNRDYGSYSKTLQLTDQDMNQLRGKRVLDVGAGLSDFTDIMVEDFGAEAVAIDVAYDELKLEFTTTDKTKDCRELFYRRHFAMDARDMRYPNNYFNLIVSNYLFNWFFFDSKDPTKERIEAGFKILEEMIRVLAVGGVIRTSYVPNPFSPLIQANSKPMLDLYQQKMLFLRTKYSGALEILFPVEQTKATIIKKTAYIPNNSLTGKVGVTLKH